MKIWEIDAAIMDCVNEDGEVVDVDRLNALEMEREAKIEAVCLWKKDLEAESKALDDEIKNLQARKRADDNKVDSIKKWVGYALDGVKFKTPKVSVSYRHSTAVEYSGDVNELPDEYCTIKREASKTKIKEALENGVVIDGAEIVERESVIIK